ncbi:MAG: hypothetical protein RIS34_232 [Pseudomonadota bacterium]
MGLEQDIERLAKQEQVLRFDRFDHATAWELGTRIRALCEARGLALTTEIRLARETVFFCAMPGTTPGHSDWARRKRNTVELVQRSSYAVGRSLELEGSSMEQKMGLPTRDYATHGGSFPIRVNGVGCLGTVTVSGAPQREDHAIVVEVLAALCGVPLADVALD